MRAPSVHYIRCDTRPVSVLSDTRREDDISDLCAIVLAPFYALGFAVLASLPVVAVACVTL